MAGKISEYTTEQTTLADTDRLDVSTDIGGTPTTEYLSWGSLKTQLGTAGFASSGDNVSIFANDAGYVTADTNFADNNLLFGDSRTHDLAGNLLTLDQSVSSSKVLSVINHLDNEIYSISSNVNGGETNWYDDDGTFKGHLGFNNYFNGSLALGKASQATEAQLETNGTGFGYQIQARRNSFWHFGVLVGSGGATIRTRDSGGDIKISLGSAVGGFNFINQQLSIGTNAHTGTEQLHVNGDTVIDGECRATTYNVNGTVGLSHVEVINAKTFTWVSGILTSVI
jgi:hypothetical protein